MQTYRPKLAKEITQLIFSFMVMAGSEKEQLIILLFPTLLFLLQSGICYHNPKAKAEAPAAAASSSWIRAGYWLTVSSYPFPDLDSSLFTHLFCAFAGINSSTFELSIPSSDQQYFASFSATVKRTNPAIQTVLSIGDARISATFMSIITNSSSRNSFIKSSIETATLYGFDGLDIWLSTPNTTSDSLNMAALFREWRSAVDSHYRSNNTKFTLSMCVNYLPINTIADNVTVSYPVDSIQKNFDWVNILSFDYFVPLKDKFVHPSAALYDPYHPNISTDHGIRQWVNSGLSAEKILIGLPYHGWAWALLNPKDNRIGALVSGPAITADGSFGYKHIKGYIQSYKANVTYNSVYVENYCSFASFWVGFDDVDAIRAKIAYAKEKGLGGYFAFQVANDENWILSRAAAQVEGENRSDIKRRLLIKVLVPLAFVTCLVILMYSFRTTLLSYANKCNTPCGSSFNGMWGDPNLDSLSFASRDSHVGTLSTDVQNVGSKSPDLKVFKFADISEATNDFSCYNKLGEGGFGPVYKGKLRQGQEIAVKRLSKTSRQGYEEFKNEVMLTARLQHVNLVKVIGFCMEREEKMLVYEYLPNKSLDAFIFDPLKRLELDWEKRGRIIEGIIQGLVYLQEYSRLTIIHRDLKASNILLDKELSPKISDFGIARIFQKDAYEANTSHIVGTYGYVPPEYVKKGIYSTKYDVYSFGVLLLQIISGKRNDCFYGAAENLNLLEYAYELWMDGRGMEFIDPALDDSGSEYKVMRCMGIGLLCVQENQEDRPSMLQVLSMLKNEAQPNRAPKRPAFSIKAAGPDAQQNSRSWDQRRCSNYMDSTVSELETR